MVHSREMFTGLVETMGTVRNVVPDGTGTLLTIEEPTIAQDLPLGASVAVNGVMAGCRPEYMPILVALVEAMADPAYGVEHSGNTPGAETLIILNGPTIKQLGVNRLPLPRLGKCSCLWKVLWIWTRKSNV